MYDGLWSIGSKKPCQIHGGSDYGARRAGKTTLVRKMGEAGRTYITLDDQTALEAAARSERFIRGLDGQL